MKLMRRCWSDNDAQDLTEYGLIAVLVSTLVIAGLQACGADVNALWARISAALSA
ncbi:MAG: Flp family type IVb pilin [Terriglobales bacterium]